jgi:exopolyphosphatase/guanosine-5'-triphosphate,3'-diphosphate pyrophosphatase
VDSTSFIAEENIEKTIDTLGGYLDLCQQHEVVKICAVGTNVLRRALNSNYFLKKVYEKIGLKVRIISGREEAGFVFKGVLGSLKNTVGTKMSIQPGSIKNIPEKDNVTVIDIGGGSCEVIAGKPEGSIDFIKSIELGSVRIAEKFFKKDKPTAEDILLADNFIKRIFAKELKSVMLGENTILIGVGGTISTVGSILIGLEKYEREKLDSLDLSLKDIEDIFNRLSELSLENRKKVKGLQPERADIIIGGITILLVFMKYFKRNLVMLCEHDILDGIIYSLDEF